MAKEKTSKEKSLFEVAREIEQQQKEELARQEAEQRERARLAEEQERIAYEKRLREERLELIRLKQGVITESDTIHEEIPVEKHYTIWQRLSNFFYHNKWWMGFACFFVAVGVYLTYQFITTERADAVLMLLVDDATFDAWCSEEISTLLSEYVEDANGDGKNIVDVYYIPTSESATENSAYTGNRTKLFAEFQLGDSLLVISNAEADETIEAEDTLYDLEEEFGAYVEVEGCRFYLSGTTFAEVVGWDEELDDDIYIGIRAVKETFDDVEEMQENFDVAIKVLRAFIEEFGTLEGDSEE